MNSKIARQKMTFGEWLDEVKEALPAQYLANFHKDILIMLSAKMLEKIPMEAAAKDLVDELPEDFIKHLTQISVTESVDCLGLMLSEKLIITLSDNWAEWVISMLIKVSNEKDKALWPLRLTPEVMAEWLAADLAGQMKERLSLGSPQDIADRSARLRATLVDTATMAFNMICATK